MLCDILICTPSAKFAQPEITLGIIPGAGGTQRLTSLVGKARAMDMVLTGRRITGVEAGEWGLVSRVTKEGENVVDEAVKVGEEIAGFSRVATQAGKEAVNGGEFGRGDDDADADVSTRAAAGPRIAIGKAALPAIVRDAGPKRG